jgi:hypothetical protein
MYVDSWSSTFQGSIHFHVDYLCLAIDLVSLVSIMDQILDKNILSTLLSLLEIMIFRNTKGTQT